MLEPIYHELLQIQFHAKKQKRELKVKLQRTQTPITRTIKLKNQVISSNKQHKPNENQDQQTKNREIRENIREKLEKILPLILINSHITYLQTNNKNPQPQMKFR